MKIIVSQKESESIFLYHVGRLKSLTAKKSMATKWVKDADQFLKDIKNAVENSNGWYLGDRYNFADIWREERWVQWLKDYRAKLDSEKN